MKRLFTLLLAVLPLVSAAQDANQGSGHDHHHHQMHMDASGMVMNANTDSLPRGCAEIGRDYDFTVHAGSKYAANVPGMIFGLSTHELRVEPCSRLTITFINEDQVRHQWMVHGLPKYLYPGGMFHIEAVGGATLTGTFIVPGDDRTYLVHCDMAQHMEKGMKGQLVVGAGSGDLWSVRGIGDAFIRDDYLTPKTLSGLLVLVLVLGVLALSLTIIRLR